MEECYMKKILALLLVLALALGMAACGAKTEPAATEAPAANAPAADNAAVSADDIPDEMTSADGKYANAASVADLAGATCTSQINTVWYDTCLPQIADADILPAQESAPAMLVALNSGRCDLVVTDMPTAMAACVAYPNFKLLDFSGTDGDFEVSEEEINIGISIRKGNAALCEAINGVLATMTADDYTAMMNDAIAVQPLSE